MRRTNLLRLVVAALLSTVAGCGSSEPQPAGGSLRVTLHPAASRVLPAFIDVTGLSGRELASLRDAQFGEAEWQTLMTVKVGRDTSSADVPAVKGKYAVTGNALTFTPLFPFDPGRSYRVTFDPGRLPQPRQAAIVNEVVGLPAIATTPSTIVTTMHPASDVVPENLLRIYIEFSAAMGSHSGLDFVKLFERTGPDGKSEREVQGAWLPVDANLWSRDHTRYTLYFDPGRVKAGILPNRQQGRPLVAGRRYVLTVDPGWTDANGLPLKTGFRYEFRAGPAIDAPIKMTDWKLTVPAAGTRDPLVVTFKWALDHAVTLRALAVEKGEGTPAIDGDVEIEANDTRWVFRPPTPWTAGEYNLVAQSYLEDPQGNRIGRAFEVFDTADNAPTPEAFRLSFAMK